MSSGEEYDVAIDALQPVETFCVFFRRGLVGDADRSATSPSAELIDATPDDREIEIGERMIDDPACSDRCVSRRDGRARVGGSFTTLFAKTFGVTPGRLRVLREDQRRVRAAEPE